MLKGGNLWFYDPVSKTSIRISAQQRLTGQASNGDGLTVNLSRDYTTKIVGEETLQDADRKNRECWHLHMARHPRCNLQSHRILGRARNLSFGQGDVLRRQRALLKIAYYHKFQKELCGLRPTEVILIDSVNANLATAIDYSDYRFQDIPDAWFQRDFLPRLSPE